MKTRPPARTSLASRSRRWLLCSLGCSALAACTSSEGSQTPDAGDPTAELARSLVETLVKACPGAAADDENARLACSNGLTDSSLLRERMVDPFVWGGQAAADKRQLDKNNRTNFNPRIFRRLYLSTFMFPGDFSVEKTDTGSIIRVAVRFRNQLDPGSFPYPFWHSADKWASYETARDLLFFVEGGKLVGALRSAERDPTRPHRDMKWDGRWTWEDSGGVQPRVSLFSYGFSPQNPHVAELEDAYRTMERELRKETCLVCHSPDNSAKMNPLELFSYPNQALSGRRNLIAVLNSNLMPPADAAGKPPGLVDDARRTALVALARKFQEAGDKALAFEGEPIPGR
jgi:hypothetical protein